MGVLIDICEVVFDLAIKPIFRPRLTGKLDKLEKKHAFVRRFDSSFWRCLALDASTETTLQQMLVAAF
jgi:hypothetical protein